jgi:hypothetical protein
VRLARWRDSTFLGGAGSDDGRGIAVDAQGSAFVTGATDSPRFPTTAGAADTSHNGDDDAFVAKLDAAGGGLVYSTFIGDAASEVANAIAVDGQGSAFITGVTSSPGFPTTQGAFDTGRRYPWALDSSGPERLPKTVYVRFSGPCIDPSQTFQDDIILDETASTPGLKAGDNASGVKRVEVRRRHRRILVAAYKCKLRLKGAPQHLTVRVTDGAGNVSRWKKVRVLRG